MKSVFFIQVIEQTRVETSNAILSKIGFEFAATKINDIVSSTFQGYIANLLSIYLIKESILDAKSQGTLSDYVR